MSENFLRVKRDILRDMKETPQHTQESWANIMLRNTQYLTTVEDQNSFWNFILNPADERDYVAPEFISYNSEDVAIKQFQKLKLHVTDESDEKMDDVERMTVYIQTKQVE